MCIAVTGVIILKWTRDRITSTLRVAKLKLIVVAGVLEVVAGVVVLRRSFCCEKQLLKEFYLTRHFIELIHLSHDASFVL